MFPSLTVTAVEIPVFKKKSVYIYMYYCTLYYANILHYISIKYSGEINFNSKLQTARSWGIAQ
jgi:hypothetical protein